jgi:hypothetical protein
LNLNRQGHFSDAEKVLRDTLDLRRRLLGEPIFPGISSTLRAASIAPKLTSPLVPLGHKNQVDGWCFAQYWISGAVMYT